MRSYGAGFVRTFWKTVTIAAMVTGGWLRVDSAPGESGPARVKLFVHEETITVQGRTVKVGSIQQANGEPGFSPDEATGFHVEVVNQFSVPTALHWLGLSLPNLMDGVP